ncbi:MAG: CarD family transcriptional regulator [bacterium]
MFKKGDAVIYPNYGKVVIKSICKEADKEYYELIYEENLEMLIPITKAESLGMRYPLEKAALLELLKKSKKVDLVEEDLLSVEKAVNSMLATGELKDVIYIIKLLQTLSEEKLKVNKKLELNHRQYLALAISIFNSEIQYVLGEKKAQEFIL